MPAAAHLLDAVEDSAVLLTVAVALGTPRTAPPRPAGRGIGYSWQEDWQ